MSTFSVSGSGLLSGVATSGAGMMGPPTMTAKYGEDDGEGEDELLPAMADDDYSAHSSWQTESKDNLKYVLYNIY